MTYKTIEVTITKPFNDREKNILYELCLRYPKEDVYFDYNDNKFSAHVRSIDLNGFRLELKLLCLKHRLDPDDNAFVQLFEQLENIKSYGINGRKRVFVDYNKERKVKNRKQKEKDRGGYYYALDEDFSKTNNPLPVDLENQIICDDSENALKQLPGNCIDLVFTSPPYNFGLNYESSSDGLVWEKYLDKLFGIFDECVRVLKYGGRIIVNVQPLFSDYIPLHHLVSQYFMRKKLIWKGEILWEKNNYNCKYTAWGSWKSPSNPYLKYTWEFLEIFCKGSLKKEGKSDDADILADEFKKWVVSKWSIAPERDMSKFGHPAMFPQELATRVIKLFSFKHDVVLDPFNGVGTTTLVAKCHHRRYIGVDISQEYCQKAQDRINSILL